MCSMTATKERVKRARPKPARSFRLGQAVNGVRALQLTVGKLTVGYYVAPIHADFGRGFRLTKFGHEPGDDGEREYLVNVDTGRTECTCKGHQYRDHCKHSDSLALLIAAGKL